MVYYDLAASLRPFLVFTLLATSVQCQQSERSARGLWDNILGAVVSSLKQHVRGREATFHVASGRQDDEAVKLIDENSIQNNTVSFPC